jgi:hypothetical protein
MVQRLLPILALMMFGISTEIDVFRLNDILIKSKAKRGLG